DSDFLGCGPGSLRYARDFAARRRPDQGARAARAALMSRLYAVESMPTSTGARADHRLPAKPGDIEAITRAIAVISTQQGARGTAVLPQIGQSFDPGVVKWIVAAGKDLQAHRGSSLVIAGDGQPPAVHALAHAMN